MSAMFCKYASATTLYFPLITFGSVSFTSTASLTTADSKISKNGAAFATTSNAVVSVGSFGYSLTLTTGDTTCLRAMIVMHHTAASPTFEDTMILIDTYGNASAQYAFDLSVANQTVVASAGTVTIGVGGLSSGAIAAGAFSAGAFAAGFLSAGGIASAAISAGGIAAAALSAGAFAAAFLSAGGIAASAISSGAFVSGAVTASGNFPVNFKDLTISATTGLVSISTASTVVAGTVSDKTGYSLTQTFPSNFSALNISATTGAVILQPNQIVTASGGTVTVSAGTITSVTNAVTATVGTNNDKTGYSLAAGQLFVKKNTALSNFAFFMRDSADHVSGKTGLTVSSQRAIDGAAFSNTSNGATELSNGFYLISLAAGDLNGTVIALKFTATGADPTSIVVITQA